MTLEFKKNTASTVFINTNETSFATFCYTEKGDLFLNSDWGNYFYSWRAFENDFEKFLKNLEIGYFFTKMASSFTQYPVVDRRADVLKRLLELFQEALKSQPADQNQTKDTIQIKGELINTHDDYQSWLKTVSNYPQLYGFDKKILHINKRGYNTTGYELKNFEDDEAFPVKSYLLAQSTPETTPFKSLSNN